MDFRILGPLEVEADGRVLPIGRRQPRALLTVLLLDANRVVSRDRLMEALWGDEPPERATNALQVYVSQLRKAIGADRVVTKAPGYSLRVEEGELDLDRFEQLAQEGRDRVGAGDAAGAADLLGQALSLWRGPAFAEFAAEPFARDAGARLDDERLAALEDRIDAELELGRDDALVPELEELVARSPYRERLRGQLMLALYRNGRQAEALDLYRRTRATFVDELGIEPGPRLQELERAILRHDPELRPGGRRRPREEESPAPRPRRRLLLALAVLALAVGAGVAAIVLSRGGSSATDDAELRTFVTKMENFLVQSRDGRRQVGSTVKAAFSCRLAPHAAAVQLDRVQRNRQSLLEQIAALSVPAREEALRSSDLLQRAARESISADWHYRDWLLARARCGPADRSPELRAAAAASARATRAKRAFVGVFDPLARRFGQRAWTAEEF
jgi:DNA-binding SARP family transcriptional activator